MSVSKDILTVDNLLHTLVAVAFVWLVAWGAQRAGGEWDLLPTFLLALLAGLGLYLREVSQVDWDFTLRFSAHKHLEWAVGTVGALIQAPIIALVW